MPLGPPIVRGGSAMIGHLVGSLRVKYFSVIRLVTASVDAVVAGGAVVVVVGVVVVVAAVGGRCVVSFVFFASALVTSHARVQFAGVNAPVAHLGCVHTPHGAGEIFPAVSGIGHGGQRCTRCTWRRGFTRSRWLTEKKTSKQSVQALVCSRLLQPISPSGLSLSDGTASAWVFCAPGLKCLDLLCLSAVSTSRSWFPCFPHWQRDTQAGELKLWTVSYLRPSLFYSRYTDFRSSYYWRTLVVSQFRCCNDN